MHFPTRRSIVVQSALAFPAITRLVAAYSRIQAIPAMSNAASAFLDSLSQEQRERATFTVEGDERFNWFYTPVPRKGLPLREMVSGQRELALALLSPASAVG